MCRIDKKTIKMKIDGLTEEERIILFRIILEIHNRLTFPQNYKNKEVEPQDKKEAEEEDFENVDVFVRRLALDKAFEEMSETQEGEVKATLDTFSWEKACESLFQKKLCVSFLDSGDVEIPLFQDCHILYVEEELFPVGFRFYFDEYQKEVLSFLYLLFLFSIFPDLTIHSEEKEGTDNE